MRITMKGAHKRVNEQLIRKALQWYAKQLFPKISSNIKLTVDWKWGLSRSKDKCDGQVTWMDEPVRPQRYYMQVDNNLSYHRLLELLAHEMVHIKQFATGEMRDIEGTSIVKWQGKRLTLRDDDRYWDHPWEIEAYGRQVGLAARFRREHKV